MGGEKGEACDGAIRKKCVNLSQQGNAVPYNWFLPVIREFKNLSFLMTDKNVSQTCTLKTAYWINQDKIF